MANYYDWAVAGGMFIGWFAALGLTLFIDKIEEYKFKRYLSECDDKKREEIKLDLDVICGKYKGLAAKTDARVFKRRTNRLNEFICFLEKYRLN